MVDSNLDSLIGYNIVDPNQFESWEKDLFTMISAAMNESNSDPHVSGKWLRKRIKSGTPNPELTVRLSYKMSEFINFVNSFEKISGIEAEFIKHKDAYKFVFSIVTLKVKPYTQGFILLNYDDRTLRNLPKVPLCSDFVLYRISSGSIVESSGDGSCRSDFLNGISKPIFENTLKTVENALSFAIRSLKHKLKIDTLYRKNLKQFLKRSNKTELWSSWKKLSKISWIWKSGEECRKVMQYLFLDLKIPRIIFENSFALDEFTEYIRLFGQGRSGYFMLYSSFMLSCYWNSPNSENVSYIRHYLSETLQSNDEIDIRIINVVESVKTLIELFNDEFNLQDIAIEIFKLDGDWEAALKVTSFIKNYKKNLKVEDIYHSILKRLQTSNVMEFIFHSFLTDHNLGNFTKVSGMSKEEVKLEELKWRLNHPNSGKEDLIDYLNDHLLHIKLSPSKAIKNLNLSLEEMLNTLNEEIECHSKNFTELKKYKGKMIPNDEAELQGDLNSLYNFSNNHSELQNIRDYAKVAFQKVAPSALNLIENQSKKYFEKIYGEGNVTTRENSNTSGIHIQLLLEANSLNGLVDHYFVKWHHYGAINTSSTPTPTIRKEKLKLFRKDPVDLKELFVYLLFNLMGLGPECKFFGLDEKIFFIATKNCCFDDQGNSVKFKVGHWLSERYESLCKNSYFIRKLLVADILQRVLLISDITSNGSNFGFVDQGECNLTNFQIIDHAPTKYTLEFPGCYAKLFNYSRYQLRNTKQVYPWGKVINSKHKFEKARDALSELSEFYQSAEEAYNILKDSFSNILFQDDYIEYNSKKEKLSRSSFEEIIKAHKNAPIQHDIKEESQKKGDIDLMKEEILESTLLSNKWCDLESYVRSVKKNLNTFVEQFNKEPYYQNANLEEGAKKEEEEEEAKTKL